jgi:cytidylate kinase
VVVVTGAQAAGKSTVGRLLAQRFSRSAFIEGDLLWQMFVSGRVDMSAAPDDEALRQRELRYRHAAILADSFVAAGCTAVHADNIYGAAVTAHLRSIRSPTSLVVLRPRPEVIEARESARGTSAYTAWAADGVAMIDAIRRFDHWVGETPRVGLWLDTSEMTADETVDEILARWDETPVVSL